MANRKTQGSWRTKPSNRPAEVSGSVELAELSADELRQLRGQVGDVARERIDALLGDAPESRRRRADRAAGEARTPFPGRITLSLPWAALASDNQHTGVVGRENRQRWRRYRDALATARAGIVRQYGGELFSGPARVVVVLYVPDRRVRDALNLAKCLCDALRGTVLTDDRWQCLREATFRVAGVDAERPRCEVEVAALE
jgi:Holliday junction resolvase RusA-like endonuclease